MIEQSGYQPSKYNRQRRQEADRNRQVAPEGGRLFDRKPSRRDADRRNNLIAKHARKGRLRLGKSIEEILSKTS